MQQNEELQATVAKAMTTTKHTKTKTPTTNKAANPEQRCTMLSDANVLSKANSAGPRKNVRGVKKAKKSTNQNTSPKVVVVKKERAGDRSGAQTNEIDIDGADDEIISDGDDSNANTICEVSKICNEDSGTEVEEQAWQTNGSAMINSMKINVSDTECGPYLS